MSFSLYVFGMFTFGTQFLEKMFYYLAISIFIFSWILQFYGHKIEGKKPSFVKDIQFLLIGPAWLLVIFIKNWY